MVALAARITSYNVCYTKLLRTPQVFATDNTEGLEALYAPDEQRVLELWPDDVTNKELTEAQSQIRFQMGLSDRFQEGLRRAGRYLV